MIQITRHLGSIALLLVFGLPLQAKTIVLTDLDCEQIAIITSEAPRLSWAGFEYGNGAFANVYVDLYATRAFLIRYPIDKVPKGMKITNAEWVLPAYYMVPAREQRLYVRRLLAEWGAGVCHQYRMVRPKKLEWSAPGARAAAKDRATKASAVIKMTTAEDQVVNVTEDVELWYTRGAPNHGWIVNIEEEGCLIRLSSPSWGGEGYWKLRITYEPSDDQ